MNIYNKSYLKYNHNLVAPNIVDVGANIGIEAMKLFEIYPDGKITLVEPQENNCDRINNYIETNNLKNNWSVFKCALDLTSGFKEFGFHHFMTDGRLNGSLDPFNWKQWNYEGTTKVETKRLEDICANPNIIKMDIERHEYIVLPEIVKNSNINIMYVEMHGPCYELNVLDFLDNCLNGTGLEVTSWFHVEQHQTYMSGEDDICNKVEPQRDIGCGSDYTIIIERN
jgi:FkbM family methyltransferase